MNHGTNTCQKMTITFDLLVWRLEKQTQMMVPNGDESHDGIQKPTKQTKIKGLTLKKDESGGTSPGTYSKTNSATLNSVWDAFIPELRVDRAKRGVSHVDKQSVWTSFECETWHCTKMLYQPKGSQDPHTLDIQIPPEKLFPGLGIFWGPNTFSAGLWMSRGTFQTLPFID